MKDPNINKNNNKDDDTQRYKDFFNSFNEASETDEVLQQLANLNFYEEKSKITKNNNFNEENISKIKFENYIDNNNDDNKEEKPISMVLLKEKINRIYIAMQGLSFKEKELNNLNDFIPCLNNIEQKRYPQIDKLLDVFINLISRIKDEINVKNKFIQKLNEVSFDIENYEKKNIINQRVIKDKENEILLLMNKLNLEKEKNEDKSKSIYLEVNSLKKENQELADTILIYKNKLRKVEAELQVMNEKYKHNSSKEKKVNKIISNDEEKSENGLNNSKISDNKYFNIKKLNMSLTYLLKEINKMLVKYDNSLINLLNKKFNLDKVIDLNCNIETNLLLDEANMKIFRKNFLYNMERIHKKMDILKKGNLDSREIKSSKNLNINEINNSLVNNTNNININNNGSGNISKDKEKHFKNNISSKWYDNYNNKKIGYVFDKEKVITCEDDDNGAK